jgi:hypothetical protein
MASQAMIITYTKLSLHGANYAIKKLNTSE